MLLASGRTGGLWQKGPLQPASSPPHPDTTSATISDTARQRPGGPGIGKPADLWIISRSLVSLSRSNCQVCDLHHVAASSLAILPPGKVGAAIKPPSSSQAPQPKPRLGRLEPERNWARQALSTTFSQPSTLFRNISYPRAA